VVFSHGWPLNADAWDDQAMLVASSGYWPSPTTAAAMAARGNALAGNDLDTYADDLAQLIETLDLREVILVGLLAVLC
jgi:non-heme chloroperoxidase